MSFGLMIEGNIRFGAPIFKSNREIKSRVVFEYGGQQSMMLNT